MIISHIQHRPICHLPDANSGAELPMFNIEQVAFENSDIVIEGWCSKVNRIDLGEASNNTIEFSIDRYNRSDVAAHYKLETEEVTGFRIKTYLNRSADLNIFFRSDVSDKVLTGVVYSSSHRIKIPEPGDIDEHTNLKVVNEPIQPATESVLIVGSAPTINELKNSIKQFEGEIWALNDAWFWLEANEIDVDLAFVTDSRFFEKVANKIDNGRCRKIVTLDTVDLSYIKDFNFEIHIFNNLGRDGFSIKYGNVFHNCSVFFTALQTAIAVGAQRINSAGVLLQSPVVYQRVDGTGTMPEYVYHIQINNARKALGIIDKFGISYSAMEPDSMLNFL